MCYMTLCCRKITTNAETVIDLCMGTGKGFPDLEYFEALGLRHMEEVQIFFTIILSLP